LQETRSSDGLDHQLDDVIFEPIEPTRDLAPNPLGFQSQQRQAWRFGKGSPLAVRSIG
jgi:hypothetical protein